MAAARQAELLRAGLRAPDFTLARLENGTAGGTSDLGQLLTGAPALLAFFKVTCPVCQMTLPFLERLQRGRTPESLDVYGISQDDAADTREFAVEFGLTFPMLLDTEESGYPASNAYGLSHVPSLFLVDRDRKIVWSLEGFNRRELLAVSSYAGVSPFLPGEKVPEWKAG